MWHSCNNIRKRIDKELNTNYNLEVWKLLVEYQKTAEVKAMIETYNKKVNFIDFSCLNKIIEEF